MTTQIRSSSLAASKSRPRKTLRKKVEMRISKRRGEVFLPKDFRELGGEDQVLRVLRELTREGRLIRLGYGVYAKARVSSVSGRPVLASPAGFPGVAKQALDRLNVKWAPTEAERAYNEGRSTQIPVNAVVNVKSRISRQLSYGGRSLIYGK